MYNLEIAKRHLKNVNRTHWRIFNSLLMALSDESIYISRIRHPSNAGSPGTVTGLGQVYYGNAIMIAVLAVELFVLLVHDGINGCLLGLLVGLDRLCGRHDLQATGGVFTRDILFIIAALVLMVVILRSQMADGVDVFELDTIHVLAGEERGIVFLLGKVGEMKVKVNPSPGVEADLLPQNRNMGSNVSNTTIMGSRVRSGYTYNRCCGVLCLDLLLICGVPIRT